MTTRNFAVIGVGGFVAPRHLKAIYETGNRLAAAADPHDSVGVLDRFGFDIRFFKEIERFDRHLDKLRRGPAEERVHYVSICSPNYLHDAHARMALRNGADAICEKPLVINPGNLDAPEAPEKDTMRVYRMPLRGEEFGVTDVFAPIEPVYRLRTAPVAGRRMGMPPFLAQEKDVDELLSARNSIHRQAL